MMESRAGTERRSGKDRRCDYDEQRKLVRYRLSSGASVYLRNKGHSSYYSHVKRNLRLWTFL